MQLKGNKQGYIIHEVTKDNILLCKILKDYNSIEDAKSHLVKLLSSNINEKDLLKDNK